MIRTLAGLLGIASLAPAADPGAAAVDFLEQLRGQDFELESGTALSPDATKEKTERVRERLRQLGERLRYGQLELLAEKTDGRLAAALVSQVDGFDPSTAQVHAVALLRRGDAWLAAPVPASFENTGIRYRPGLGPAAERLEGWLLEQRPIQLDRLRKGLDRELLRQVRASLPADSLANDPPEKIVESFIQACRDRDLAAAAAFIGGLENPPPSGWRDQVELIASALRPADEDDGPRFVALNLRWLYAPIHVTRTPAGAIVSVGFFDPGLSERRLRRPPLRHFTLGRTEGGSWRLELPDWLGGPGDSPPLTESALSLARAFPLALFERIGTQTFATPEELGEATMQALVGLEFRPLLRLIRAADEDSAGEALVRFARRWSQLQANGNLCFLLDHHIDGDQACGLYAEIDPYRPEVRDNMIFPLAMVRSDGGWCLADDPEALTDPLREWFATTCESVGEDWLDRVGLHQRLGGLPAGPPPDADAALRTATAWIDALQARAPHRMLEQVALFDDIRSVRKLFSFIGQEFPNSSPREILGIHRNGRWAGASIRHQPPPGDDEPALDLLHPIVSTSSGPKLLPEAILYLPDTRPRRFLNNEVWKRLGERLPEAAIEELRKLLEDHTALCRPEPASDPATDE